MKGKVKTQPFSVYAYGSNKGLQAVKNNKVVILQESISMNAFLELQELIVVFEKDSKLDSVPLKFSQWQHAIDNGEVNSDKVVEFDIVEGKNRKVAKIRPELSQTDANWNNVIHNLCNITFDNLAQFNYELNIMKQQYILIKR